MVPLLLDKHNGQCDSGVTSTNEFVSSFCIVAAAKRPPHGKGDGQRATASTSTSVAMPVDSPRDLKERPASAGKAWLGTPAHRWARPFMLHLAIDSIGKTRGSKSVDYTRHIVAEMVAENNIMLSVSHRPGGDLPELTDAIKTNTAAHAHMLISMSNYAVESIDEDGVSQNMLAACDALCEVKQQVKVIYGGAGELWRSVGNKLDKFEDKTMTVRNYLQARGMDVDS